MLSLSYFTCVFFPFPQRDLLNYYLDQKLVKVSLSCSQYVNLHSRVTKYYKKHEEISCKENHTFIKDTFICKYCDTVYSDAGALRKHTKNYHKIKVINASIYSSIKRQRLRIFRKIIQENT